MRKQLERLYTLLTIAFLAGVAYAGLVTFDTALEAFIHYSGFSYER